MATDNSVTAQIVFLPDADARAFERATDIYRALLAAIDAHLDRVDDPVRATSLRDDAQRYAAERHALDATDHERVQLVVDHYPALVRKLQAALG